MKPHLIVDTGWDKKHLRMSERRLVGVVSSHFGIEFFDFRCIGELPNPGYLSRRSAKGGSHHQFLSCYVFYCCFNFLAQATPSMNLPGKVFAVLIQVIMFASAVFRLRPLSRTAFSLKLSAGLPTLPNLVAIIRSHGRG